MRLLAVDDDPVILDLLPVVFREADLPNVNLASSAEAALEVLSDPEAHYDCLLFDIRMHEMNGVELCRQVRAMAHHRDTPILMLTSVRDHVDIERAFAAGANDYITKPFEVKEIATPVRVVQRMVSMGGPVPTLDPNDRSDALRAGVHEFSINDPLRLNKTESLILPFSLGNYLSQLSRSRLNTCTIFGVKVEDIGALYGRCDNREFASALSQVVSAIGHVVNSPSLLVAYEGDGMFVCITQQGGGLRWPEMEEMMQDILDEGRPKFSDGAMMPINLAVGNPVSPNASRTQRVKKTFDRAIGRAMMREKTRMKRAPRTTFGQSPGVDTFRSR